MTQEEKELVIRDLSGRIPYDTWVQIGIYVDHRDKGNYLRTVATSDIYLDGYTLDEYSDSDVKSVKAYLRPMSSMTEEEQKALKEEQLKDERLFAECLTKCKNGDDSMRGKIIPHFAADWCNKEHFDYRGLIPKGLANVAPEGMYKND